MAPKRTSPLDHPPPAASSSEEEMGSTEDEGSSSDDDDLPPRRPSVTVPASSLGKEADSSSEESDSDDEAPAVLKHVGTPDSIVKPLASKPMEDASKSKKPRSKPSGANVTSASQAGKRPSESEMDGKDSKRAKKKDPVADGDVGVPEKSVDDAKKQLFQRLWSEDDEIEILKGMIEYATKKGADPAADMNAFHDFIKKSLHVEFTKAQLMDKIRRLKKKYVNNFGKGKKGEDRLVSKPHEQKAYELSKKVWGKDGVVALTPNVKQAAKSNGKAKDNQKGSKPLASLKADSLSWPDGAKEVEKVETEVNKGPAPSMTELIRFDKNLGVSRLEEIVVKQGLDLIGGVKKVELEEKWKKLHMAEMEVYLRRTELIQEQTKLVLEAYKSAGL